MAATNSRPSTRTRGKAGSDAGVVVGKTGGQVIVFTGSAAPTDGASGTGAGVAAPGSLYIRASTTNSKAYINTNTTASPTWTVVGAQTA